MRNNRIPITGPGKIGEAIREVADYGAARACCQTKDGNRHPHPCVKCIQQKHQPDNRCGHRSEDECQFHHADNRLHHGFNQEGNAPNAKATEKAECGGALNLRFSKSER